MNLTGPQQRALRLLYEGWEGVSGYTFQERHSGVGFYKGAMKRPAVASTLKKLKEFGLAERVPNKGTDFTPIYRISEAGKGVAKAMMDAGKLGTPEEIKTGYYIIKVGANDEPKICEMKYVLGNKTPDGQKYRCIEDKNPSSWQMMKGKYWRKKDPALLPFSFTWQDAVKKEIAEADREITDLLKQTEMQRTWRKKLARQLDR